MRARPESKYFIDLRLHDVLFFPVYKYICYLSSLSGVQINCTDQFAQFTDRTVVGSYTGVLIPDETYSTRLIAADFYRLHARIVKEKKV